MKKINQILIALFMMGLSLFLILLYDLNRPQAFSPDIPLIQFNETEIEFQSATQDVPILFGLFSHPQTVVQTQENRFTTSRIENTLTVAPTAFVYVTHQTQALHNDQGLVNLNFEETGTYIVTVQDQTEEQSLEYVFTVEAMIEPDLHLSELQPFQGGIVFVSIENIPLHSDITVESHYTPSYIYQVNHEASFYLPMAYKEAAGVYPLIITLNGQRFSYELDVQSYTFKEVHFTVESSVVSSTVGNNDAVLQYREVIYPTYESVETEIYWSGNFILPVEGARISSNFGEMRFVNNATVPTRHAGIDYAVECQTEVVASNAGKVEVAQFLTMIGNTIVIDHGLGLKTYYEHMDDLSVKVGDLVSQGQVIGHVGTTGYSTGCHLHFQSMVKNQSFNPEFLYDGLE